MPSPQPPHPAIGQTVELTITGLISDGRGIGRTNGLAVFVDGAIPGQTVRARVLRSRKRLLEAELLKVLIPCGKEQMPPCPHAATCGGCAWQSLPYTGQLYWKQRIVHDALQRLGGIKEIPLQDILPSPSPWGYRNKMEFAFGPLSEDSHDFGPGLRQRGSHAIVPVTGCLLQTPRTMRVLEAFRTLLQQGKMAQLPARRCRFLVIREPRAGGCFVELIVHPMVTRNAPNKPDSIPPRKSLNRSQTEDAVRSDRELGEYLAKRLHSLVPEVTGFTLSRRGDSSDVAYAEKIVFSCGEIHEHIRGIDLRLGPASFFQVNTAAAELLYAEVERLSGLTVNAEGKIPVLWDLYAGIGSIGFSLVSRFPQTRLLSVEEMPGAVRLSRINAKRLGIACRIELGDTATVLARLQKEMAGGRKPESPLYSPDVIIADPPRAGLDEKAVLSLNLLAQHRREQNGQPPRLIYVSCNPATLARDIARLSAFTLKSVRPVDLFPQTPHVECVALLTVKSDFK